MLYQKIPWKHGLIYLKEFENKVNYANKYLKRFCPFCHKAIYLNQITYFISSTHHRFPNVLVHKSCFEERSFDDSIEYIINHFYTFVELYKDMQDYLNVWMPNKVRLYLSNLRYEYTRLTNGKKNESTK